jgi:dynein heavy chain 1
MEIFEHILYHNKRLESITDTTQRLDIILKSLFETIFIRVSRGMLHRDRVTLAVQLTRIYLKNIIRYCLHFFSFSSCLIGENFLVII